MNDFSGLRFTVTRLCGGQDLMLTPDRKIPVDIERVHRETNSKYTKNDQFVKFDWNGLCVTVYPAGSVLFFFFNNRPMAEEYARKILEEIVRKEDETKVGFVEERL